MGKLTLLIYGFVSWILHYLLILYTYFKKVDSIRDWERFGCYQNQSELIRKTLGKEVWWFNCASAGEFNAIKRLLREIDSKDRFIVITTSTISGAKAFSSYLHPSDNIIHCYVPYDTPQAINKFLYIWRPTKIILVESEIWPNIITKGSKIGKVHIINGRLSPKSFERWARVSWLLSYILTKVESICAASKTDFYNYQKFYKKVVTSGNLKYDSDPLSVNPVNLKDMRESVGPRKVIVFASTHKGEEEVLIRAYKKLLILVPDLLLILIPRHIERGSELSTLCFKYKLVSILRDRDGIVSNHVPNDANVYIMNTMGELGIAFSLGKIVFMGGSIIDIGGHNCCEPAMFECAIISGKNMSNFIDLKNDMINYGAIIISSTEDEIFESVKMLLNNREEVERLGKNAKRYVIENSGALTKTLEVLLN